MILVWLPVAVAIGCGDDEAVFGRADDDGSGGASTSTASHGAGGAGQAGGGQGGAACSDLGEPCSACEVEACAETYCACYGNLDCGLYASCVFACPENDADCYQSCNTQHANGISDAVLLNDCASTACPSECSAFPLVTLTPCQRCLYQSCGGAMNACLALPDCTALLFCLDGCGGDQTCANACWGAHPNGVEAALTVGQCAASNCGASCG